MTNLNIFLLLLVIAWFWLSNLRVREIATAIGKAACSQRGVQFLDQTVALRKMSIRWLSNGLYMRRIYRFDYSEQGEGRYTGHITMLGMNLESISMGLPDE